jgi:two-component system CheB/CheR fusion protein
MKKKKADAKKKPISSPKKTSNKTIQAKKPHDTKIETVSTPKTSGHSHFLRTLAKDQGEKAICVILSGTGTDGTLGLKAIKGEGGMVMVQDPITAKYGCMPRSAIETNMVDYIVPANKMPEQMIKYVRHSNGQAVKKDEALRKTPDSQQKIFILFRSHTGHDFSLYKKNTIIRRVERRISLHQIDKISDYVRYLQEHRHELDLLFKEIIIGVTNFFRDKEAFAALKTKICPRLFRGKSSGDYVRIWVVVCSTGEEAYSIAVVFRDDLQVAIYMRRQSKRVNGGLRSSATFA